MSYHDYPKAPPEVKFNPSIDHWDGRDAVLSNLKSPGLLESANEIRAVTEEHCKRLWSIANSLGIPSGPQANVQKHEAVGLMGLQMQIKQNIGEINSILSSIEGIIRA